MKKTILIIMTVAVLGALGLFVQKKPTTSLGAGSSASSNTTALDSAGSGSTATSSSSSGSTTYKDGTFTGSAAETPYGTVQIAVVVSGGKITDVNFLKMPNDQGHSIEVTSYAEPLLKQNTLAAQSANIEFVSGATSTSYGYEESLQKALDQAAQA